MAVEALSEEVDCPYVYKEDPWSSHSRVLALLADLPPGARVLEVGAATGLLGRLSSNATFSLYGLEPNDEWATIARPHYAELRCCSLDEAPDDFLNGHDVVILADVLEHMVDPETALTRLVKLEPVGCRFIISVPNVANLWIRLSLLLGRFTYGRRGILDGTHLRFFTRGTFLKMIESSGLRVTGVEATPIPLGLVHVAFRRTRWGRSLHRGLALLTQMWPTLLGYQFVAQAVKPAETGD